MPVRSCLNCGAALSGPYCPACGQKDLDLQRPFAALAADFLEAFFNLESRAWRTLALLPATPGLVTRRYLSGQRARYVGPVKLYALLTFVFFVVLNLSDVGLLVITPGAEGVGVYVAGEPAPEAGGPRLVASGFSIEAFVPLDRARGRAGSAPPPVIELGPEAAATVTPRLRNLMTGINELTADPGRANELLEKWLPRLLILLVPLFAVVLKLVFLRRRVLLYDHLVFSLYFHASVFLLLTIVVLLAALGGDAAGGVPFATICLAVATLVLALALHQAYGGGIGRTAARLAACAAGYAVVFTAALNAVVYYGLR